MDLVVYNASVLTLDEAQPRVQAVLVRNGVIAYAGANDEARRLAGAGARLYNANGMTVVPGFNEAHNHMLSFGLNLTRVDCSPAQVNSISEILERLRQAARNTPPGQWILGWGYDDIRLNERRHPLAADLDQVAPDHPVFIWRTCAHSAVVNSKALEVAGVTSSSPDPQGGYFERSPGHGQLTGRLVELPAASHVFARVPSPSRDELQQAVNRAAQVFIREGITSATEAAVGLNLDGDAEQRAFIDARESGEQPIRINLMVLSTAKAWLETGVRSGFGDDWLRVGSIKFFLDGGIGNKTAAVHQPFAGTDDNYGILFEDEDAITERMEPYHKAGWQIAVHAIGDRAIDTLLNAYERLLTKYPRRNHRHRIEHMGIAGPEAMARARRLGLVAVPQFQVLRHLGDSYINSLEPQRLQRVYAVKSMMQAGLYPAGSSDRPVVPGAPLEGIQCAVMRRTAGGRVIAPEESVSALDALRMYTINGAYASHREHVQGTLTPGKLGDLVVLDGDPTAVNPEEICDIRVRATIIGGQVVYEG